MARYVALLRGINVGGKNKVPMADLRDAFEALGFDDVSTFIQSGNVVFSAKAATSDRIEKVLADAFGLSIAVVLRTPADLRKVLRGNPFADADPKALHVGFMTKKPSATAVKALDTDRFSPEQVAVVGPQLYFHLPNGIGRAKLPLYVDRQLKIPTTVRNWNTVTKLVELAAAR